MEEEIDLSLWVTVDDGRPATDWADCAVQGCTNKRCAALSSRYCYPHSTGVDPAKLVPLRIEETVT